MKKSLLLLCLISFFITESHSQISFTRAQTLLGTEAVTSGVAVGIADMNGDGLDDIVRMEDARILNVIYQTIDCNGFQRFGEKVVLGPNPQWNIAIGDLNNDGFNDVIASGVGDGIKQLISQPQTYSFDKSTATGPNFFTQAANLVDINNDGYLDAFVCDDNGPSKTYINDSTGHLVVQDVIDFSTVPPSDESGNYGSLWIDYDSDGDLDLYIAKCRQNVTDPADPRRINVLYENDGTGHFINTADSIGLADGGQSWTADFGDIDGDGDLDCFVTNHEGPSSLFENHGDTAFVDIIAGSGLEPFGLIIQGSMRDFDNDGWLDILIAGTNHEFYRNNGDKTFTLITGILQNGSMASYSIGDLNNDGFLDVYGCYNELFNSPSNEPDKLWLNDGNDNHFVQFNLIGDSSNRSGIGARVEIYGDWGVQIREIRSGEGYGISLSHLAHFGIGQSSKIDSLVIKWPAGTVDIFNNVETINTTLTVKEGTACLNSPFPLSMTCAVICAGESVTLIAPPGMTSYQWSNGESTQSIAVNQRGLYFVMMTDSSGCVIVSESAFIDLNPIIEDRNLVASAETVFCSGQSIEISAPEAQAYLWNTGSTSQTIVADTSGTYFVTLQGSCDVFQSDTIEIITVMSHAPEVKNDTLFETGEAVLVASGIKVKWYDEPVGGTLIYTGDSLLVQVTDSTATFYVSNSTNYPGASYSVGQQEHSGNSFYNGNMFNGGLIFDAALDFILDSCTVFTEFVGDRIITIQDESGATIFRSDTIFIDGVGRSRIAIGAFITAGNNYVISTDGSLNQMTFGSANPKLYRSDDDVVYPFEVEGIAKIKTSPFGNDFYYYFYDWKISRPDLECESERVAVRAVLELGTSVQPTSVGSIQLYPNPVKDRLYMDMEDSAVDLTKLRIFDVDGRVQNIQIEQIEGRVEVNLEKLVPGMYFVFGFDQDWQLLGRFVKSE